MADDEKLLERKETDNDYNDKFMIMALNEAKNGSIIGEVPVGCVLIDSITNNVVAKGHNLTQKLKNGTKHCEINCIDYLYKNNDKNLLNNKILLNNYILYVTVEPCIMCASALSILNIKKVFYGCSNKKFGGNGSILSLNNENGFGFNLIPKNFRFSYLSKGGFHKNDAINLLKNFYEKGNNKLPVNKRARKVENDS